MLFHHRFSTSTIDVRNACHPFSTKEQFEYQYIGVHNGVLKNERELRKEHEALGIKYVSVQHNDTFNDSEALIYDLARYLEGQTDSVKAEGRVAFVIVKRDINGKPLTLFFGHNTGSPLVMKKTDHSLTISSLGEGEMVPYNTLQQYDYETGEIRSSPLFISQGNSYRSGSYTPVKTTPKTGGASQGKGFKSNNKAHTNWDDFRDDFQIPEYTPKQQQELIELRDELEDDNFHMRAGDAIDIHQAILSENGGSYAKAALMAILEAEEATREIALIGSWIKRETEKATVASLITYIQVVSKYKMLLMTIADDFNDKSREPSEKEEAPKEELGFHQKSPADKRLLPSSILANNKSIN